MASFSQKEMNQLRTQMYRGFITKSVPRYEWRGAGRDGRAKRQTGYSQVTNYDAYNSGLLKKVRNAVGIKNVNRDSEIRRIYDYISGYKQPAPAPAPAPAPQQNYSQTNLQTNSQPVQFDTSAYDAQIKKLSDSLTGLQSQLKANQASYAKSLSDQATNFQSLFSQQQTTFDQNMAAQTDKYDKNMSSLRNSIAETMSSSQQPAVGVKTGAYGKQSAALQRQGVRGSFGRTGLRIKQGIKDKSLNI